MAKCEMERVEYPVVHVNFSSMLINEYYKSIIEALHNQRLMDYAAICCILLLIIHLDHNHAYFLVVGVVGNLGYMPIFGEEEEESVGCGVVEFHL